MLRADGGRASSSKVGHVSCMTGNEAPTMSNQSQISATISAATKDKLDRFSESHGFKKNFVVEQALLYFMEAWRDLPDEAFIPARLVVDDEAFDRIVELVESPPPPTEALRELMRGKDG
jgi:uncharacterized protein (DUF1778 family)